MKGILTLWATIVETVRSATTDWLPTSAIHYEGGIARYTYAWQNWETGQTKPFSPWTVKRCLISDRFLRSDVIGMRWIARRRLLYLCGIWWLVQRHDPDPMCWRAYPANPITFLWWAVSLWRDWMRLHAWSLFWGALIDYGWIAPPEWVTFRLRDLPSYIRAARQQREIP